MKTKQKPKAQKKDTQTYKDANEAVAAAKKRGEKTITFNLGKPSKNGLLN